MINEDQGKKMRRKLRVKKTDGSWFLVEVAHEVEKPEYHYHNFSTRSQLRLRDTRWCRRSYFIPRCTSVWRQWQFRAGSSPYSSGSPENRLVIFLFLVKYFCTNLSRYCLRTSSSEIHNNSRHIFCHIGREKQ